MSRWGVGLVIVLLSCVPILLSHATSPDLLRDTDTQVLLDTIRQRQAPLSWFGGDWPLENHFYRPVSTLFFELDNALYGSNAAGYGWTNALLCVASVVLLFWLWRELADDVPVATLGAIMFALWHTSFAGKLSMLVFFMSFGAWILAFLPGRRLWPAIAAFLVLYYLSFEVAGFRALEGRMIAWLPGRTASVMTVFALLSMAGYARYERLSASRVARPEPTPLDPPATKGTVVRAGVARTAWGWLLLSLVGLVLALGSYEQAVMLPAALFGVAVSLRLQRYQVRWGLQALFWGLLVGYLALRSQIVPTEASGYQLQQFRSGPGVWQSVMHYIFPAFKDLYSLAMTLDLGPLQFMSWGPWGSLLFAGSNLAAYGQVLNRRLVLGLTGFALSLVTFLPMAWLKPFDHYDYWPMAMRSLFVSALVMAAGGTLVSAASRPAMQAPARPDPAPGSLPRR
ncbi:MAG TPA: hypothetical protein VM328_00695 [Fimbriimonadaceae bacterium]|nr:hypothetical protein [Fimbriimonadaceae bacterium]